MLTKNLFRGNMDAYLAYVSTLTPDEARQCLLDLLNADEHAPLHWALEAEKVARLVADVDQRTTRTGTAEAVMVRFVDVVTRAKVTSTHHGFVSLLVRPLLTAPSHVGTVGPTVQQLVEWLEEGAGVGDQGLVAEVFAQAHAALAVESSDGVRTMREFEVMNAVSGELFVPGSTRIVATDADAERERQERERRSDLVPLFLPLARWLLRKGSAELRRPERAQLLPFLLDCLLDADVADLELALRYVSLNARAEEGFTRRHAHKFWIAVERVLAGSEGSGVPGRWRFVCELAATLYRGPSFAEDCLMPLASVEIFGKSYEATDFDRSRGALLVGLVDGRFDDVKQRLLEVAWKLAAALPAQGSLIFGSQAALESARDHIVALAKSAGAVVHPSWFSLIANEYVRIYGAGPGLDAVEKLAACSSTAAEAVADALRTLVEQSPVQGEVQLARELLASTPPSVGLVRAVLACDLLGASRFAGFTLGADAGWKKYLEREFLRIACHPWAEPIFGIHLGRVLGGLKTVQFNVLKDSDLVERRGETLWLNKDQYEDMAGTIKDEDTFIATATLYFIHELVHEQVQGIGHKITVERLRETGAETTLLHLDLAADHAAAMLTTAATPRFSLHFLKDLQGRSSLAYTVGRAHPAASRLRKAMRLASLRFDFLVRTSSLAKEWTERLGQGYAFIESGPSGGQILALVSGPPLAVLDGAKLDLDGARILETAMDEGVASAERIAQVDGVLRTAFRLRAAQAESEPEHGFAAFRVL